MTEPLSVSNVPGYPTFPTQPTGHQPSGQRRQPRRPKPIAQESDAVAEVDSNSSQTGKVQGEVGSQIDVEA